MILLQRHKCFGSRVKDSRYFKNISGLNFGLNIPTIMDQFCPLNFVTVLKQQLYSNNNSRWVRHDSRLWWARRRDSISLGNPKWPHVRHLLFAALVLFRFVFLYEYMLWHSYYYWRSENHRVGLNYKLEKIQQNYYQIVGLGRRGERGRLRQNWFCYYFCC